MYFIYSETGHNDFDVLEISPTIASKVFSLCQVKRLNTIIINEIKALNRVAVCFKSLDISQDNTTFKKQSQNKRHDQHGSKKND